MTDGPLSPELQRLALTLGIEWRYRDAWGRPAEASPLAVASACEALRPGSTGDIASTIRQLADERAGRVLEPVTVLHPGRSNALSIRVREVGAARLEIHCEDGSAAIDSFRLEELPAIGGGGEFERRLPLPNDFPIGRHRLRLLWGRHEAAGHLLVPPPRATPPRSREWGIFAPLGAIPPEPGEWAVATHDHLARLGEQIAQRRGSLVATWPLLSPYTSDQASPYSPGSRLFWNEAYVDPRTLPELDRCPAAQARLASVADRIEELRRQPTFDPAALAALSAPIWTELAASWIEQGGEQDADWQELLRARPELPRFAAFRAFGERRGDSWMTWPEAARGGQLTIGTDPADARHRFSQLAVRRSLQQATARLDATGGGLYLDLPIGVHPDGFDAWQFRQAFWFGVSAGAPPDSFFTAGQDWGFPPLHPEGSRSDGHDYLYRVLCEQMRWARVLRIDHVMGLHRIWVVPRGLAADHGVYVRYRPAEIWALALIASVRHGCTLVGEDLGTVPDEVRSALRRKNVLRLDVGQARVSDGGGAAPRGKDAIASLNTHDMPPFAGFLHGVDIDDARDLGRLDEAAWSRDRATRWQRVVALERELELPEDGDDGELLKRWLVRLGASQHPAVLVQLEDLWLERRAQNVPGTTTERLNWRRRAIRGLAELGDDRRVLETLDALAAARQGAKVETPTVGLPLIDATVQSTAPGARRVDLVSDGNDWDPTSDRMNEDSPGLFSLRVSARAGERYRFRVTEPDGSVEERADPFAPASLEPGPPTSVFGVLPDAADKAPNPLHAGAFVYRARLAGWRRVPEDGNRPLTYSELAPLLVAHLRQAGFTHLWIDAQLDPGYGLGTVGPMGSPVDLRALVDTLKDAGLGVIADWPAASAPSFGIERAETWIDAIGLDGLAVGDSRLAERLAERNPDRSIVGACSVASNAWQMISGDGEGERLGPQPLLALGGAGQPPLLTRLDGSHAQLRCILAEGRLAGPPLVIPMGDELGQLATTGADGSLDWHLLDDSRHRGVLAALIDAAALAREIGRGDGMELEPGDDLRARLLPRDGRLWLVVAHHGTTERFDVPIPVPVGGHWREVFNSDAVEYAGGGLGNWGGRDARLDASGAATLAVNLAAAAVIVFVRELTGYGV